jgi:L-threonylcarbamoyladenylate synthase
MACDMINGSEKEQCSMVTERIYIEDKEHPDEVSLKRAAKVLKDGGLVAFPTETVYGLGANALKEEAAKKIYAAKGRPSDNPLIAHIAAIEDLAPLVLHIPEAGRKLMEAFWPGPLTLVFQKSDLVPYGTTGGLDTVAVRMPSDPVASTLIRLSGVPIAAPSANTSGRPSPTTADHVWQDMNGKIDMVVDGGAVGIGVESTIIDVSGEEPMILRPGAITQEMASKVLGQEVCLDPAIVSGPLSEDVKPKAPGMKYRHYAPKASLTLVEGDTEEVSMTINRLAKEKLNEGFRVGIICTEESKEFYQEGIIRSMGVRAKEETIAHNLYGVLREFDDLEADYIYSESFSKDHLGQAIMNRLTKAAGYHILKIQKEETV